MENQLNIFDMMFNADKEVQEEVRPKKVEPVTPKLTIIEPIKKENKSFVIGERVRVKYSGELYEGIIQTIYNNGETINCCFDAGSKHTAFYIGNIYKLDELEEN
ncbi:MAG: hypothetical protein GX947_10105 [Tissierellia bacterium]|nr:hypothetical protein [Tissierellia bacterium]